MHLFDIDIPGKMTFKESETLSPGRLGTVVDTPQGTIAIGICYDLRFPELAQIYTKKGAKIIIYPGGPSHHYPHGRAVAQLTLNGKMQSVLYTAEHM